MAILPIAERELRQAARRRSTYWIRLVPISVLLLPGFSAMFLLSRGAAGPAQGRSLFTGLATFVFGLCALSGAFLTADALSEEKREGTLGFLFLTDLRGHDVVLGKLAARMLNPFYSLLGILPALALCLLVGGISAGEFWRTAAALVNALLFSLSLGILVSALSREQAPAVGRALLLVGILTAGLPLVTRLLRGTACGTYAGLAGWPSPYTAFSMAQEPAYRLGAMDYWGSLLATLGTSSLALGIASAVLPRVWQDRPRSAGPVPAPATAKERRQKRAQVTGNPRWLDKNPVWWLIGGDRFFNRFSWLLVLGWGVFFLGSVALIPESAGGLFHFGRIFGFLLKCLIAFQACRFFADARRSGLWELLLSTPLSQRTILKGHWLALRHVFLWPVLAFLAIQVTPFAIALLHGDQPLAGMPAGLFGVAGFGWFYLSMVGDIFAVALFGTWLSLSMKQPRNAAAATIVFVLILPSLLFCFLDIIANLIFILYAVGKMSQDFRRSALISGVKSFA